MSGIARGRSRLGMAAALAVSLLTLAACGGSGSDDAATTTTRAEATTTTAPGVTARRFASVIAEHREEILTLQTWRDLDCALMPDDAQPVGCPVPVDGLDDGSADAAMRLTFAGAQSAGKEMEALGAPDAEAKDLVESTLEEIHGFERAREAYAECWEPDVDVMEKCEAEFDEQLHWANSVLHGLTRWEPYL